LAKDFCGVSHFLQRGVHHFQIHPAVILLTGFQSRQDHFPHDPGPANPAGKPDQLINGRIKRAVAFLKIEFHDVSFSFTRLTPGKN
jgi:hypothetical protein